VPSKNRQVSVQNIGRGSPNKTDRLFLQRATALVHATPPIFDPRRRCHVVYFRAPATPGPNPQQKNVAADRPKGGKL
jgi:hypothetical protein